MKKLMVILLAVAAVIVMTGAGCKSMDNLTRGISEKSISSSGMVTVNRVGLDKTNQTPELFNLFMWGDYNSVAAGDEVLRYEASEDASVFNSNAKTYKSKLFFASGNKKRMDDVLAEVKADMKARADATAKAAESKTAVSSPATDTDTATK